MGIRTAEITIEIVPELRCYPDANGQIPIASDTNTRHVAIEFDII